MPNIGRLSLTLAGLSLLGLGCVGSVMEEPGKGRGTTGGPGSSGPSNQPGTGGGQNPGGGGGGSSTMGKPAEATPPGPGIPGQAVFRRLTRAEYNNTVRDLVGDTSAPANAFPEDSLSAQSGFSRGGAVSGVDADRIFEATVKMANELVGQRLSSVLPCGQPPAGAAEQDTCADEFISKFGRRAFRRPLTNDELAAFRDLYKDQRNTVKNDFPGAIRVVVSAMLLSPNFLYRWETVPSAIVRDGNFLRFNGYEMASRLSYGIWASMPDDALFAAAEGNKLGSAAELEAEVRRMLKDQKAREGFADFVVQWLDVSDLKDQVKSNEYTAYNAQVAAAMLAETKTFFGNLLQAGDGKLSTLLTSNKSFVDEGLAKLYQSGGVTGTELKEAELNSAQRGGILTLGAFLAAHGKAAESAPVLRGKTIADRVLCKDLPPPPDDVPPPKPPLNGVTTRQRFEDHSTNPCAAACHNVIDPLGFAYENYDAVGQWRTMDMGKPVNAAATVAIDGKMESFANAIELGKLLANSQEVVSCMSKQWLRYMLRRHEVAGDEASLLAGADALGKANGDLRELIVALTKTKSFTHRTASAGELLP